MIEYYESSISTQLDKLKHCTRTWKMSIEIVLPITLAVYYKIERAPFEDMER